jgi:hypothetical protein
MMWMRKPHKPLPRTTLFTNDLGVGKSGPDAFPAQTPMMHSNLIGPMDASDMLSLNYKRHCANLVESRGSGGLGLC